MDLDGKSKTAAAVEGEHKPQTNVGMPTSEEIKQRAHQLWLDQGCPSGMAEQHWLDAERELHDSALSRRLVEVNNQKGGSVQS